MSRARILQLLEEALHVLADKLPSISKEAFPLQEETSLKSIGMTGSHAQLLMRVMENRLGIQINFRFMFISQNAALPTPRSEDMYSTVGHMVSHIESSIRHYLGNPTVVFVDPDKANRQTFEKVMGRRLRVKTFGAPLVACKWILKTTEAVLVLTRETMPRLSGEELRQSVHHQKPFLKCILIEDEVQKGPAPRRIRDREKFHSIVTGPFDLNVRAEEISALINHALSSEFL